MKRCTISHSVPGKEPGRFREFKAGELYDPKDFDFKLDEAYFEDDNTSKKLKKEVKDNAED